MWACEPEATCSMCETVPSSLSIFTTADKLQYWTSKLNKHCDEYHKIKIQILRTIFQFYSVCFIYAVINHHVLESKLAWIHVMVCFIHFQSFKWTHNAKMWVPLWKQTYFSSTTWWMQLKWHLTTPPWNLTQSKMHIRRSSISYVSGSLFLHCWTS